VLRQLSLAEVADEGLRGNAPPELLEQGFVGHQALKGHGRPEGQSPRMASPGILAEVLAITAELAWSSPAPKQPIPRLQHKAACEFQIHLALACVMPPRVPEGWGVSHV
jgi:hypothetical protein